MRKTVLSAMIVALGITSAVGLKARAAAADTPTMLAAGAPAPDFKLPSQEEKLVGLKEYKGKFVVLYFYPKDMTTGCTIEAHNFQRDLDKYTAANAVVLGVSLDTVESHKTFCSKDSLTFKLLADPDHKVIDAYGVPVTTRPGKDGAPSMSFAQRDTFLIGPDGKVIKTWVVAKDLPTHSEDVLAAIAAAKK